MGRSAVPVAGQLPGPVVLAVEHAASGSRVLDASLELHAGEILGVAGMVGAGRTELAHAIFGSAALVGGRITVAGKPVAGSTSPLASIRRGMGFLTEDRKLEGLFLQLSVAANIMAPSLREIARSGFLDRKQEDGIGSQEIKKFKARKRLEAEENGEAELRKIAAAAKALSRRRWKQEPD